MPDKWAQYEVQPQADKWAQYEVKPSPSAQAAPAAAAAPAAGAPQQASAPSALQTGLEYGKEILGGIGRGIQGLAQGTQQMAQPRTPGEAALASPKDPLNYAIPGLGEGLVAGKHLIGDTATALGNMYSAQKKAGQQGEGAAGRTLAAMEQAPVIGGAVQHAEQGGPHMFSPQSVGAAAELGTYYFGPKAAEGSLDAVNRFVRRAKSINDVTKAGAGVYQGQIQPTIQKLQAVIQNEGAKTIQGLIDADKADAMVKGTGSVSNAKISAQAAKALDETDYQPTKAEQALLDDLTGSPEDRIARKVGYGGSDDAIAKIGQPAWDSFVQRARGSDPNLGPGGMTLDEAVKLRSTLGNALFRRGISPKAAHVLGAVYNELTDAIGERAKEIGGPQGAKAWNHYNNEFSAFYGLKKGITGEMLQSINDRHEAIPKLKDFAGSDLTEVKQAMKKYGLDPKELDKAQANARTVVDAHSALAGKFRHSLYNAMMIGGPPALLGAGVYGLAHGAGLYGFLPYALGTWATAKVGGLPDRMKVGQILDNLNINPEQFQVRTPVEGPMKFNINPDEAYSKVEAVKKAKANRR